MSTRRGDGGAAVVPFRRAPGAGRSAGHLAPGPPAAGPHPVHVGVVRAVQVDGRLAQPVVPPQGDGVALHQFQETLQQRVLGAAAGRVAVRVRAQAVGGGLLAEIEQGRGQQTLGVFGHRPHRGPLGGAVVGERLGDVAQPGPGGVPGVPLAQLTLRVQLALPRVHGGRPERRVTVHHHRLVTVPGAAVALHRLAQRTGPRVGRGDALAAAERAQPRAQPGQGGRAHGQVLAGEVGLHEVGAAAGPADVPDDAGDRVDQMAVAVEHLLRGERPVSARILVRLGPGHGHEGGAHLPGDQLVVAARRALRQRRHRVRVRGEPQGVQDVHGALPGVPDPGQPLRRLQRGQLGGRRRSRGQLPGRPARGSFESEVALQQRLGAAVAAQPRSQTGPARPGVRPEHRAHPGVGARRAGEQPGHALGAQRGADAFEGRVEVVRAQDEGEGGRLTVRREAYPGLPQGRVQPGRIGAGQRHHPYPGRGHFTGREAAVEAGQVPVRLGGQGGRGRRGGAQPEESRRLQRGERRPCRVRPQRERGLPQHRLPVAGAVQQWREDLRRVSAQRGHSALREQIGGLSGDHGDPEVALETDEPRAAAVSPGAGHARKSAVAGTEWV